MSQEEPSACEQLPSDRTLDDSGSVTNNDVDSQTASPAESAKVQSSAEWDEVKTTLVSSLSSKRVLAQLRPIVLVCGPKNVGKSSFCRFIAKQCMVDEG